ncbi:MAG TPA: hypothetical protein DCM87_00795 [Planctomycetes bacterium]|nr:hypothetical protein [Planctomycetota bacterium]
MRTPCALLGTWAVLLAAPEMPAAAAPELDAKDLAITPAVQVPAESTLLAARSADDKTIVYTATGATILFAEEGAAPMTFATLPGRATSLAWVEAQPYEGLAALTEQGDGFLFAANGAPTALIKGLAAPVTRIAFTTMPLYHRRPHGTIKEGGQMHLARFGPASGAGAGRELPLGIESRLGALGPKATALAFAELPWQMSLLALTDAGQIWRIDSLGKADGWLASKSLAGGRDLAADTLGLLGGGIVVSTPARGELWTIGPDNAPKRLAKGLEALAEGAPCQGAIAVTAGGTLCVLAGTRVALIAPPKDGPLAQSVRAYRQAEKLYLEAKWQEAAERAQEALKGIKSPRAYLARVQDLVRACEGAPLLERAKGAVESQGLKKLLPTAQKLEQAYGQTRLGPELALFRKRCEIATNILIINDFEDRWAAPEGLGPAEIKVRGSAVRRASAPDPVKEGAYSLLWRIPGPSPEGASLSLAGTQWGDAHDFLQALMWVWSARDRFQIVVIFLNGMGQELARYPIALKKGWQQLIKPPMQFRGELQPLDLTVCTMVIEAYSPGPNEIYLDDIRFTMQRRR